MASETVQAARPVSMVERRPRTDRSDNGIAKLPVYRPTKQPYVFTQVVRDDSDIRPRWQERTEIAQHSVTQRHTWPTSTAPKQAKPRYYSFDQTPTLTRTPWEAERYKRHPSLHLSRNGRACQLPAHVFEQLPHEVYSCILGHLGDSYTTGSVVDVAGQKQAYRTLCLTSKRWAKVAIEHMYRDLWLPSSSASTKRSRRFSMARPKSKLELLMRTLDEAPSLAFLIRRVHVTSALAGELSGETCSISQRRTSNRMLRDVVARCTEVELISGFTPPATQEHAEWFKLLASRSRLTAHAWLLDLQQPPVCGIGHFASLHENWQHLETLTLCKTDTSTALLGPGTITAITARLPSLKHLMLSNFSKPDFHNGTLLSLPPLKSLRLENLPGITDQGLHHLSLSRAAYPLQSLSLINLELASLRTLQTLLANLPHLLRLRLVQTTSPTHLTGADPTNKRHALASPTLQYLHWDTLIPGPALSTLAHSLQSNHLPALQTLKIPSDPHGCLQALCRPIQRHPLTSSDLHFLSSQDPDHYTRSLRLARLQAQLRIRESRATPGFDVVVSDEEERTLARTVIGAWLGDVRSRVEYVLEADVEGGEEGLAVVEDCLGGIGGLVGAGEKRGGFGVLF